MPPSDSSAASLDPEFAQAEKLVRNARTLLLPTGWSNWRDGLPPPEHKLPVDEELTELARILSPSEVRARYSIGSIKGWPSHQTAVRFQLAWYAEVEFQDFITYAAEQAPVARRRLDLLCAAEESLVEDDLCFAETDSQIRSVLEQVRTAKARASSELHEIRPPQGGRPPQSWKGWFVVRIAGFWQIITGEQPPLSPDSDFAELVSAAWNSLHPKIPEITWDSFIRGFAKSANLETASKSKPLRSSNFTTLSSLSKPTRFWMRFDPAGSTRAGLRPSHTALQRVK
jgi:hypothetical protein